MAKAGEFEDLDDHASAPTSSPTTSRSSSSPRAARTCMSQAADPHRRRQAGVRPRDRQADERARWRSSRPTASGTATRRGTTGTRRTSPPTRRRRSRSRSRARRRRPTASSTSRGCTADGKLDIDVYFGWDYHSDYHLKHSQGVLHLAQGPGLHGAGRELGRADTRHAAPFTRTVKADGKTVNVEVRIYFGKPGTATDPDTDAGGKVLEDIARASLDDARRRRVLRPLGPVLRLRARELEARPTRATSTTPTCAPMQLPPTSYQVVLAEGCDTYQIGEAFRRTRPRPARTSTSSRRRRSRTPRTPATVEDFVARAARARHARPPPPAAGLDAADEARQRLVGLHADVRHPRHRRQPEARPVREDRELRQDAARRTPTVAVRATCASVGHGGQDVHRGVRGGPGLRHRLHVQGGREQLDEHDLR